MNHKKNIVLFVNDSYFSYLLSKQLIESYHENISCIVFSKSTSSSLAKILNIYRKVPKNYFFYRVFVQILSKSLYRKKSVEFLADQYAIEKCTIKKSTDDILINKLDNKSVAFAFNFDLILKRTILTKFHSGIYNIHASKLPKDKGISPVLWAFARGDKNIWSTIYKMDAGIDSGPIAKQLQISIEKNDSAFSLYRRVCLESGVALSNLVNKILEHKIVLMEQPKEVPENIFSWPDSQFSTMLKTSNRKLIKIKDIIAP
ncbi:MAG: hypothetical protein GQ583_04590 [Methyloprofundus sp.]|nr:hypothetical protein [Methyloprofundus sp.]